MTSTTESLEPLPRRAGVAGYPAGVTPLTAVQRRELHERIAREQQRAADRIAAHERDFDEIVTASAEAVRDDEHDPEGPTIAYERAQVASLLAAARAQLAALQRAAERLYEPDAGRCVGCDRSISYERLLAQPATTRCVECARS